MPSIPVLVSVPFAAILGTFLTMELLAAWDVYARRRELRRWLEERGLAPVPVPASPASRRHPAPR